MKISTPLSEIRLDRADGDPVALAELWRDTPVVLVWIRHFG